MEKLNNLKPSQKRYFLTQFTELAVFRGHDISWIFGKNLSRFNYEKLFDYYVELVIENASENFSRYEYGYKEEYINETIQNLKQKLNLI